MRLIDADVLKEYFPDNREGSWTYNVTVKACIDAQPTVDAVPVIRCKDCRFYEENCMGRMICIDTGRCRNDDDFCSRAV